MSNMVKIKTVNVKLVTEVQEFLECCSLTTGKINLTRGETTIPSTSRLGVISLCDGNPFNMVFTNCSDEEISRFNKFEYYSNSNTPKVIIEYKI